MMLGSVGDVGYLLAAVRVLTVNVVTLIVVSAVAFIIAAVAVITIMSQRPLPLLSLLTPSLPLNVHASSTDIDGTSAARCTFQPFRFPADNHMLPGMHM